MTAPFYATKGWWKSKTVWTGIVSAVVGVLALFGVVLPFDPVTLATTLGGALTASGILTVLFRTNATTALTASAPAATVTPTV